MINKGDKCDTDLEKYGVVIRDYSEEESHMKKAWLKKNKVKPAKKVCDAKYPCSKVFIKGY